MRGAASARAGVLRPAVGTLVAGAALALAGAMWSSVAAAQAAQAGRRSPPRQQVAESPRPVATSSAPAAPLPRSKARDTRRRTVIVDAGHGGIDRGMTGYTSSHRPVFEKDIVLAVAKRLANRLENAGVNVVMTRTADTLIGLYDRGPMANRSDGDLFISIHVNAANPHWKNASSYRGFETYFLAEARTEDERRVAEMENSSVQFDTGPEMPAHDNALGFMLNDMLQNEHLRESSDLAATIQDQLRAVHPGPSRGVKQGNLVVLVKAFMPAVLVEIGYGSNPAEADWMTSSSGQAQVADAISRAALDYLTRFERRVAGGSTGK